MPLLHLTTRGRPSEALKRHSPAGFYYLVKAAFCLVGQATRLDCGCEGLGVYTPALIHTTASVCMSFQESNTFTSPMKPSSQKGVA